MVVATKEEEVNVGSVFSGIGGLDAGLARAGFDHAFLCEVVPYRRAVLRLRFPGVPVYDDVRTLTGGESGPCDVLAGGSPCQDVSVAGKRAGLRGDRSVLFFEFARLAAELQPEWLLFENVPGLLTSRSGDDFGTVLGTLAHVGYGLAWRVLDSRFFGVPQRRRRVYVVGARARDDHRAAAERASQVLAVGASCGQHPQTRRRAPTDVAVASLSGLGDGGPDDNDGQAGRLIVSHAVSPTIDTRAGDGPRRYQDAPFVAQDEIVRRLTPRELERLQGLPDDWTQIEEPVYQRNRAGTWHCKSGTADSPRYRALGDAVTANVAEWIGRRLQEKKD